MKVELFRRGQRPADFKAGTYLPILFALVLGVALFSRGSDSRAASSAEPKGLEAMRALALELLRAEDYARSIEVYEEIVRQTPDDARSHYDLAAALSFVQRYEESVAPIRNAIRIDPENVKAQEMASLIFLKLRWYAQAFEATLKAAELGEPTAMYSLVNMYEKGMGVAVDVNKAVDWATRAAEHGHLGAMALMENVYREGRLGRRIDDEKAEAWANRLREAKTAQK